jgi:hypothetical protein
MPLSGLIIWKPEYFISVRQMSNDWSCIPTIRPGTSTTRQTRSAAGTHHRITTISKAVAASVADAGAVLITGPANAKTELADHIRLHDPALAKVIAGIETVDHPSDPQLVAYAKTYMKAADRMQP